MPPPDRHDANRRNKRPPAGPPAGRADVPGTPTDRPQPPTASGRGEDAHDDPSGVTTGPSGDPGTAAPLLPVPAVSPEQERRIDALLGTAAGSGSGIHDNGQRFTRDQLVPCRIPTDLFAEVIEAADYALAKHGPPTTDPVRACGILTEELGEATECALKATSQDPDEQGMVTAKGHGMLMREELLQVAGYAMLQIVNIDRGRVFGPINGEEGEGEGEQA